jgi:AcrR family transcriptional regulator
VARAQRGGWGGARPGAGRPRRTDVDDAVLGATLELLARELGGEFTVDAVADLAGVAKTTIYRRWPTKNALIAAAIERLYLGHVEVPDEGSLARDLVTMLQTSYDVMVSGAGRVLEPLIRRSALQPEVAEAVRALMHRRRRAYLQVLNRAVARGELPPGTPHELIVDVLLGPFWFRMLVTGDPIHPTDIDGIVALVITGATVGLVGGSDRGTSADGHQARRDPASGPSVMVRPSRRGSATPRSSDGEST